MESRKILLGLLGIYLLVVANSVIASGAAVDTTTAALTSTEDIVTEGVLETEPYTTPAVDEVTNCVCNCKDHDQGVVCATEAQEESQTESTQVDANENTTTNTVPNGESEGTTEAPNTNQDTTAATVETETTEEGNTNNGESEGTTKVPSTGEDTTAATVEAETTEAGSASNGESNGTTEVPNVGEVTTTAAAETETASPTTTEASNTAGDTTTTTPPSSPPPVCSTPGVQPHETDCHAYYDCSSSNSSDGSLHLLTKFCAANEAFSVLFGRCSREISACANDVVCLSKGGIADPLSNNSYFLCEPRLIGGGFYVFHVKCSANKIFYPELGKCFIDFNNWAQPQYPAFPPYNWNQLEDIDLVKAELKLIKQHDKLQLKFEKEKIKAEKKLQKEAEKEAQRLAKEQEKLVKEQLKQESAEFVCSQEGNFPSQISDTVYYRCVVKKTKYKVVLMKCPVGSKFSTDAGVCVTSDNSGLNVADSDDESDEGDYDD